MIYILLPDNTVMNYDKEKLELAEAQEIIGGYVEMVYLYKGRVQMLVDEDGLRKGLAHNAFASVLSERPIVGKAILLAEKSLWD